MRLLLLALSTPSLARGCLCPRISPRALNGGRDPAASMPGRWKEKQFSTQTPHRSASASGVRGTLSQDCLFEPAFLAGCARGPLPAPAALAPPTHRLTAAPPPAKVRRPRVVRGRLAEAWLPAVRRMARPSRAAGRAGGDSAGGGRRCSEVEAAKWGQAVAGAAPSGGSNARQLGIEQLLRMRMRRQGH